MGEEIHLQHQAFDRACRQIVDAHADLQLARDRMSDEAHALFDSGWSGVAANEYAQGWQGWERGADRVLRSLLDLTAAMQAARGDLTSSDRDAGLGAGRLRSRLGDST